MRERDRGLINRSIRVVTFFTVTVSVTVTITRTPAAVEADNSTNLPRPI